MAKHCLLVIQSKISKWKKKTNIFFLKRDTPQESDNDIIHHDIICLFVSVSNRVMKNFVGSPTPTPPTFRPLWNLSLCWLLLQLSNLCSANLKLQSISSVFSGVFVLFCAVVCFQCPLLTAFFSQINTAKKASVLPAWGRISHSAFRAS